MKAKTDKSVHFVWRENNRTTLLIDGQQFYPSMLAAIEAAHSFVLLEMYLFESGSVSNQFIHAFCQAVQRGVQVVLLLDDFGCRGLRAMDKQRLQDGGVQIHFYNPAHIGAVRRGLFRDHRKLLIVDGLQVFIGGAGITDEFSPVYGAAQAWRETMLQLRGPCVVDWVDLFVRTWQQSSNKVLSLPHFDPQSFHDGMLGRAACTHGQAQQEIKRALLKRIRTSERRVWIATAYFVPSIKIRRALARAARRGVDVRLLLPGPITDHPAVRHAGRRFYYSLLRAGVRILEYQPRFTHSKVQMCDSWVSLGSSNIDRWNFYWNLEANQEIDDQRFAQEIQAMFERDFGDSIEIQTTAWLRRPWYWRLLEWFWGRVDLWLDRITKRS